MTAKTMFVGGARSGKSRLALESAERHAGPLHYLATAEAGDGEMAARIARHRAERGARWRTIECPLDLPEAIAIVTNEVGLGIVPAHPLGREFRDAAGRLNQKVAAGMGAAYFVVSGLVLPLRQFG